MTTDDRTAPSAREKVEQAVQAHQDTMAGTLDNHLANSGDRLERAIAKTSEAIGDLATFAKEHAPESVGDRIEELADRARGALQPATAGNAADAGDAETK